MSRTVSLSVNNMPIDLDEFVAGYLEQVTAGIVASLKGTDEVNTLKLTVDNEGQVSIILNGSEVSLKYFPVEIIRSTIMGMIAPLKGVSGKVDNLEITIG